MLFEQIARNRRHTIWLLTFMAVIVLAVGLVFAWAFGTDWMWIFWLVVVIWLGFTGIRRRF